MFSGLLFLCPAHKYICLSMFHFCVIHVILFTFHGNIMHVYVYILTLEDLILDYSWGDTEL